MNFYEILKINNNATKVDIKKAYRELTILYHPDKSLDPTAKEKFQEIKTAYEVLSDDNKRKHYDLMSSEQKSQIFDLIKQYFTDIRPEYSYIYKLILDYLYSNQETEFENDINNFDIKNIYKRITDKINLSIDKNLVIIDSSYYDLYITFEEKYKFNIKKVKIVSDDNYEYEYLIPLYQNQHVIKDKTKGDIVINIICQNNTCFQEINEFDLLCIKKVSLSQYIYGDQIKIILPNKEFIKLDFESCLEKKPIFIMEQKGLPILHLDNYYTNNRGNLYVYITIEGINSPEFDDLANSYTKVIEETLKLMFPPIE